MKYQGINLENVKNNNRSAILSILNNSGAMSRKDIAARAGLTPASVTLICAELLEEGVIYELGELVEEKRAGRKKILVDINPSYRHFLCICIESDETCISVTDCKGNVKCQRNLATDKRLKPEIFLLKVAQEGKEIMKESGAASEGFMGAAVSLPGMVDRQKGISVNTFSIWTEQVPVKEILEKELSLEVVVENNLKASAESELLFGSGKDNDGFLILKWGPGVGSAIIIDHRIYQGANGLAGEIGHVSLGKGGKVCNCGRRGCLETEVSTHAIMADILFACEDEKKAEKMPVLKKMLDDGYIMTYRNVHEWAAIGDPGVKKILEDKIDKLAFSMRNYISVMNPEKVILTGYLFDVPGVFEKFTEIYKEYDGLVPEGFFARSGASFGASHIEPLATALNEWLF